MSNRKLDNLAISPLSLKPRLIEMIGREIDHAKRENRPKSGPR